MRATMFEKIALGLSGLIALVIGASILFAPQAFYASYGITLGKEASLLSELRAPGAGLAGFGLLMLRGIWRQTFLPVAIAFAGVIAALIVELAIAAFCLAAFRRRLWQSALGLSAAQPAR